MADIVPLSSKLAVTASRGFALLQSRQPHYHFDWHVHDCAMLLWPQAGALDSRWMTGPETEPQARRLVRHTALLLPASAAHCTRSGTHHQRHGELYLRSELLGAGSRFGVFRLDGAAVAMLDALAAPALASKGAEPLVQAILAQLAARQPAQWLDMSSDHPDRAISQRVMDCYRLALEQDAPLPTVEAVAGGLGVSVRRLQRACAAELGCSPVALRRRLLASKARELLADGLSPTRVGHQLGFAHSGHLNRLLRDVPS